MKTFEVTTTVTNCLQCPYRGFDGGVAYCTELPLDKYKDEYTVYQQNKEQLTDSCPGLNK